MPFLIPFERQYYMNIFICTHKYIYLCSYMLSRTTALYCKCIKQKNGNIPLTNIIAYIFTFLLVLYIAFLCLRSFHSCLLFFLSWFHDFMKWVKKRNKKNHHHHHHYKISLPGCPTKDVHICINIYLCYGSGENNNNNQIWDDIFLIFILLNQNSLCVWPSDDVRDVASALWNLLLSNCLFDVNVCCCYYFVYSWVFHIINLFHWPPPSEGMKLFQNTTKLFNCVKILE